MVKELGEYNFPGIRRYFVFYHKGVLLSVNELLFTDIAISVHSSAASTNLTTKASHPIFTKDLEVLF